MESLLTSVHRAMMNIQLRAEKTADDTLIETFVDSGPLLQLLSNTNSSVLYGRRGTGKTHALKYIERNISRNGDVPIYIDMRSVGSNTSIYNDTTRQLSDRATQLIADVFEAILAALYPIAVDRIEVAPHKDQISIRLDDFQSAISSVKVIGTLEREKISTQSGAENSGIGASVSTSKIEAHIQDSKNIGSSHASKVKSSGIELIHMDFSSAQSTLAGFISVLGINRLWLLFDEWSEVPIDLQPYLADLVRRTILPIFNCVVKIAAIEHRSNFVIKGAQGAYVGLELGADISANLNLDDFLVFDADQDRSIQFFKNLIFKHCIANSVLASSIPNPDALISTAFTQNNVFAEFVRAVEGVPRDALNLATTIATKAYGKKITMQHIRSGARDWYQRDKSAVLRGNATLSDLLDRIIKLIIGHRKSRAFLVQNNIKYRFIEALFDARLLHIAKKNISSKDDPGVRYDVYRIDFGCYVDLINTVNEPLGLFQDDDDGGKYTEVPKDDYRSIRSAVLRPEMLALTEF